MTEGVAAPAVSMTVVATAGHVDHGKSTLVRALTGMEPDRLAEEQRRGLTMDLGFAWTELPAAGWVAFVDVPGHVDFIKNMLAGVAVVQACLLVVDAREGWRAQTEEHLRILEFAGVEHGFVVVTKRAAVDRARAVDVAREIEQRTANSFLAQPTIVECDAVSGFGLDELRKTLDSTIAALPPLPDVHRPRLWVDRSFTIAGAGTVVTGGLAYGAIAAGDQLDVIGGNEPLTFRVRGLEALGARRTLVGPGSRAALNLANAEPGAVTRGSALVRRGDWHVTDVVDVALHALGHLDHPVTARGAYLAYVGSGEHPVTLRILQDDRIHPGTSGWARLRLPRALPLVPGDHFVLRESGRAETVGGGEILDVAPVTKLSRAAPDRSPERVVRERGWVAVDDYARLTGMQPPNAAGRWVVDPAVLEDARMALLRRIEQAAAGVDVAALDEKSRAVLGLLVDAQTVEVRAGIALRHGRGPDLAAHPYLDALDTHPFAPPHPAEFGIEPEEHATLVRLGLVVTESGFSFSRVAVFAAGRIVLDTLAQHPEGVTVSQVRDRLGVSRKWAVPLLTCLDRFEITARVGDRRVAGRKAAGAYDEQPSALR